MQPQNVRNKILLMNKTLSEIMVVKFSQPYYFYIESLDKYAAWGVAASALCVQSQVPSASSANLYQQQDAKVGKQSDSIVFIVVFTKHSETKR